MCVTSSVLTESLCMSRSLHPPHPGNRDPRGCPKPTPRPRPQRMGQGAGPGAPAGSWLPALTPRPTCSCRMSSASWPVAESNNAPPAPNSTRARVLRPALCLPAACADARCDYTRAPSVFHVGVTNPGLSPTRGTHPRPLFTLPLHDWRASDPTHQTEGLHFDAEDRQAGPPGSVSLSFL